MTATIGQIAAAHASDAVLAERMAGFYDEVDAAIANRNPVCTNRGLCCNFDVFGHDLFVTTVELAFFLRGQGPEWRPNTMERRCPWQVDGRCTAREHRPMGCRVFFCDEQSRPWQAEEYEKHLAALKAIGEAQGVEYRYVEWLSALESVPQETTNESIPAESTGTPAPSVDPRRLPVIE